MRIHLGHHFYGAGNLGDDFMLAGFLGAMRTIEPRATFTCCVPFALEALRLRFPAVEWLPWESADRERCIAECDVWLGLGGSPFQSALSRWFVDHLVEEAGRCERLGKPMFFLGIGVQTAAEMETPEIQRICAASAGIWTRDASSAENLARVPSPPPIEIGADLAHLFFREMQPPRAVGGRLTFVPNFDYGSWPGQAAGLRAIDTLRISERIWLAQESRELPGAERSLYAALPIAERARWTLVSPEKAGAPLGEVLARWPSGEWLLTARYHAALAGAWSRSKVVVISTNEKLRAAAREIGCTELSPDADEATVADALQQARPSSPGLLRAERAAAACADFVRSAVAARR